MQLITSVLLFQAGALAAQSAARAPNLPPRSSPANYLGSNLAPRQSCDDGQECADICIPMDAMCCDITVGIYCEAGETCTTQNTCCADGLTCDENVSLDGDCSDDETLCGPSCMPSGAECCDSDLGAFCYEGTTCLSSVTCDLSGGDNSDDSDDSSDDDLDITFGDDDNNDDTSSSDNNDSSSNDNDSSSSNDNDSSDRDDDDDSEEDAGFSVSPNTALVILGAALTLLF